MLMIAWLIVAVVILVAVVFIFLDIEYGWPLAGLVVAVLAMSYWLAGKLAGTPVVVNLPVRSGSAFDIAIQLAAILLVLSVILVALVVGRRQGRKKTKKTKNTK